MPKELPRDWSSLSPSELSCLAVLALMGKPVARTRWQRVVVDGGFDEWRNHQHFHFLCTKTLAGHWTYVPNDDHLYPEYAIHPALGLEILRRVHGHIDLHQLYDRLRSSDTFPRFGVSKRHAERVQLQIAAITEQGSEFAVRVREWCTGQKPAMAGRGLAECLGAQAPRAWLEAMPEAYVGPYLQATLESTLRSLGSVSPDVLEWGLASKYRGTALTAARICVLSGCWEAWRQRVCFPERLRGPALGIEVLASFVAGRFVDALHFGDRAIAGLPSRAYRALLGPEGLAHLLVRLALSTQPGAWRGACEALGQRDRVPVAYRRCYGLLDKVVHAATRVPGSAPTIELRGEYDPNAWPDVICAATVCHWLGLGAEAPRIVAELENHGSRAQTAGLFALAQVFDDLRRSLVGEPTARACIASARQSRPNWALALEQLAGLKVAGEGPANANEQSKQSKLIWQLSLTPPDMALPAPGLWAPELHYKSLPAEPRLLADPPSNCEVGAELPDLDRLKHPQSCGGQWPPVGLLGQICEEFGGIVPRQIAALPKFIGHPRVIDQFGHALSVERGKVRLTLERASGPSSPKAVPEHSDSDECMVICTYPPELFEYGLLVDQSESGRLIIYERTTTVAQVLYALGSARLSVPQQGYGTLGQVLTLLASVASDEFELALELDGDEASFGAPVPADARPLARLFWTGCVLKVQFRVAPLGIQGPHAPPGRGAAPFMASVDQRRYQTSRDLELERANLEGLIQGSHVLRGLPITEGSIQANDLASALDVLRELERLLGRDRLLWPEKRRLIVRAKVGLEALALKLSLGSEWLTCTASLAVDEGRVVSLRALLKLRRIDGRFVQLGDDEFVALTEELRQRLECLDSLTQDQSDELRLGPAHLPAIAELCADVGSLDMDVASKCRLELYESARSFAPSVPRGLRATLRGYQHEGFIWMARLAQMGLGAVLADDMGLGKTIQALGMLCHRQALGPALVVAPASVVHNWKLEIERFAAALRVKSLANRRLERAVGALGAGDVLVCSYGQLTSRATRLSAIDFATIVFDEAHALKNPAARRTRASWGLQARFRIALTGTPIENHLGELWSLMQACVPGLLGSQTRFSERFAGAGSCGAASESAGQLRTLIRPFVLRRTKERVLRELPPCTESTLKICQTADEATYYEALRSDAHERVYQADRDGRATRTLLLAEISRLRRAAVDPRLVDPDDAPRGAKLEALVERLITARHGGHKSIVFTQFLGAMQMIRDHLNELAIGHLTLDGSTSPAARAERIAEFQSGHADVFVMSLHAGGVGINLTAADYVFHVDPWWNPAVEDQATSRAHRMGQTRPVTVYRLVTQHSIEEKILALHASKRELAENLLTGMGSAKRLDLATLQGLLDI